MFVSEKSIFIVKRNILNYCQPKD